MSEDDLDVWLEALGGRDRDGGSEEGRALRAQIRAQPAEMGAAVAEIDSAREAQLIARARAADLLPCENSRPPQARAGTRKRRGMPRALLTAAALAGIAIGVASLWYTRAPTGTFRGAANGVVELETPDPRGLKLRLIRELKDAGVSANGYERLDRVGVDADLPIPVAPNVRRVLERHHIPVPDDGALVVEMHAPEIR